MILSTHGIIGSQIVQATGLLAEYPGAAAAYSLRLLRSTYTGSAIRVRRTDLQEMNIGFDSNGELDTTALLAFTGTGALDNGFVKTWYDQSGNARDATQATAANQPQIVSGGSVILVNNKPNVQFTNTLQTNLNLSNTLWTYTGNSTIFHTSRNRNSAASQYGSIISQNGGNLNQAIGIQWQQFPNTATRASTDVFAPGGMSTSTTQAFNTQLLCTMQWQNWSTHKTNGNTIIAINGTNQSLTAYGANPTSLGAVGPKIGVFDSQAAGSFLGDIQELVIYTTALSQTNMDGAETNINDFYSIY